MKPVEESTNPSPVEDPNGGQDIAIGTDELNLAEFPLAVLSSRVPSETKTLVFEDRIKDQKRGEFITRRLTITAADKYGLPTALDEDVIVGLIQLTKASNNFTDRTVNFSRYALVNLLGWPDNGQSYKRIEDSLKRWVGVTLSYEKAWWDRPSKRWLDEHFHILDNVKLVSQETRARHSGAGGKMDLPLSSFSWNSVVFRSFEADNVKRLDLKLYFRLTLAPAKRAFRFLDKRFYRRSRVEFDLRQFACEKVGLSKNYDIAKIKEKLHPSIEELERVKFIEPSSRDERYLQQKPGVWKIVLVKREEPRRQSDSSDEISDLETELNSRGVSPHRAKKFVNRYPAERILAKIQIFDELVGGKCRPALKNPPGYLASSIEDDYGVKKEDEARAVESPPLRIPETIREVTGVDPDIENVRQDSGREEFLRYWGSLTSSEQARLREAALGEAKTWQLERYKANAQTNPHIAQPWLEVILRSFIEKQGLARLCATAPAA